MIFKSSAAEVAWRILPGATEHLAQQDRGSDTQPHGEHVGTQTWLGHDREQVWRRLAELRAAWPAGPRGYDFQGRRNQRRCVGHREPERVRSSTTCCSMQSQHSTRCHVLPRNSVGQERRRLLEVRFGYVVFNWEDGPRDSRLVVAFRQDRLQQYEVNTAAVLKMWMVEIEFVQSGPKLIVRSVFLPPSGSRQWWGRPVNKGITSSHSSSGTLHQPEYG